MPFLGHLRLVLVLALMVVAGARAAAEGPSTHEANAAPPARGARAYPLTYHVFGSDSNLEALARYDMVVGYASWNVRALRKMDPNGIFLLNPGLQPRSPRDYEGLSVTYGAVDQWKGGTDRLGGGPKLGYIRPFDPYWDSLHNADGSVTQVNGTFKHEGWNLADPTGHGTAELVAKVFAYASKLDGLYRNGWDGIHSDNWIYRIGVGWFYGADLDADRNGRVDDYEALRRNWAAGLTEVGLLLRSYLPGMIVGGNGNWNVRPGTGIDFRRYLSSRDDNLKSANYTLLEGLELYASRADEIIGTVRQWLGYKDPRGLPRYFAILHKLPGGLTDYRSMRWGLSLATIAGASYEAYASSHADMSWYDEYDGGKGIRRRHWLGEPVSSPQKLPSGVWRRDFRNGIVLNNSTQSPQSAPLGGVFWHLRGVQDPDINTGRAVRSVTIPAQDGLFLLRRPTILGDG